MAKEKVETMTPLVLCCDLISAGPLLYSKRIMSADMEGESPEAKEERTWRERMHVDDQGCLFIPNIALKQTLANTAKYLSEKVPGKGQATYSKHFASGIMVIEPLQLGIKAKDIEGTPMLVPAQPSKPKGAQVTRIFPIIAQWQTKVEIVVLDPILLSHMDKVKQYVVFSGKFIGLLGMRVGNGGQFGRYSAANFRIKTMLE